MKKIKSVWHDRNQSMTITRWHAALFLLLAILPMILALAILDKRTNDMQHMMDAAIQGVVISSDTD